MNIKIENPKHTHTDKVVLEHVFDRGRIVLEFVGEYGTTYKLSMEQHEAKDIISNLNDLLK